MSYSEPSYAIFDKTKPALPWYLPNLERYLGPEMRRLLKEYSYIPEEQQMDHIYTIRDRAWAIRTYPCTGLGLWLDPYICKSNAYPRVLERMKHGGSLLDIGCHVGSDLRRMVFDGAPSENMYAIDIISHWNVGLALFNDQDRLKAHFLEADLMAAETDSNLKALNGRMDIISASAVFHQWNWQMQLNAAKSVLAFSNLGSLIVGHQIGNREAGELKTMGQLQVDQWRHDPDSFARMWDQVGKETGTRWKTEARLLSWEDMGWFSEDYGFMPDGDCVLDFVVTRLQ